MGKFLRVPENIEEMIEKLEPKESFFNVVRLMDHDGEPTPNDFIPDFENPSSRYARNKMSQKGEMARIISEQESPDDYCVSLHCITTKEEFDNFYKRMERHRRFISIGNTDDNKGEAFYDKENHVMYFLYDFEQNNPYVDFRRIDKDKINYEK